MIYFFRRGQHRLACETRLNPLGVGYELVVTEDGVSRVEPFTDLPALLSREHELVQAWRATGWTDSGAPGEPQPIEPEDWLGRR